MNAIEQLFVGFGTNCMLFVLTLVMSLPLGLLITFCTMSKFKLLRWIMRFFVWVIRGTPLMLQLFVVFYAPGLLFGTPMSSRMTAAVVAFVINYAAYFSEIYRGGIESIPVGQYEAGQVMGLTKMQVFFKIVLMQVVKRITPAMGNEFMTLAKDTALARVIGVVEILMNAQRFASSGIIWPLFASSLYFLALTGIISIVMSYVEKKMDYYKG